MKLYTRIALIIIFSTLSILLIGKLYVKGYNKFNYYQYRQVEEAAKGKTNYDITFFGTSRTLLQIDPAIIDSVSHLNSYNFGIMGGRMVELNMLVKLYLEHHTPPKVLVLDLPLLSYFVDGKAFFKPNRYYAFLNDTVVYNTIGQYKQAWLFKNIPATRITDGNDIEKGGVVMGVAGKIDMELGSAYKGYIANRVTSIKPCDKKKIDSSKFIMSEQNDFLLKEISDLCKSNKITFVITYSPLYNCVEYTGNPSAFFEYIKNFSEKNGAIFLNYENWMADDNNYFSDPVHLNRHGSQVFSKLLITDILKIHKG